MNDLSLFSTEELLDEVTTRTDSYAFVLRLPNEERSVQFFRGSDYYTSLGLAYALVKEFEKQMIHDAINENEGEGDE